MNKINIDEAEFRRLMNEIDELRASTLRQVSEQRLNDRKRFWHPFLIVTSINASIVAITILTLKLTGVF